MTAIKVANDAVDFLAELDKSIADHGNLEIMISRSEVEEKLADYSACPAYTVGDHWTEDHEEFGLLPGEDCYFLQCVFSQPQLINWFETVDVDLVPHKIKMPLKTLDIHSIGMNCLYFPDMYGDWVYNEINNMWAGHFANMRHLIMFRNDDYEPKYTTEILPIPREP